MDRTAPLQRPNGQVSAASLTASTTGVVLWTLERYVFHDAVPAEVAVFVMMAVPAALGRLAAELHYRRARHRLDCP